MATNADETVVVDDDKEVTEDDLRNLKYGPDGVETEQSEDEPTDTDGDDEESDEASEEDGKPDDQAPEEEEQSEATDFVKEFPNIKGDTPEEYAKNLEIAYQESTKEAMRLKGIADAPPTTPAATQEEDDTTEVNLDDPLQLWAKQELDKSITSAYESFQKEYPQVTEPADYTKFTRTVAALSSTIMTSERRLATPDELYSKAAVILGWEKQSAPTEKDKLGMALKGQAGMSTTPGASGKPTSKSKVTDAMIKVNRMMYPGKTDDEIRKELEPYV